ncbi:GNAT family N-acetyltransferase [Litoreibacter arenae]|uniref:Ribosomal-protein-S18p-alanine acetyltransferase n=1 Tax=Litoreibacter arenae DSM 19593 TaxID=1123360 RepID=S9RU42_9RHOB|nr:GNAT family N-acetyltransferase [Litoreibacter arenae]EPX81555.1 Ribosomal-protein-S18p-alanine acetyltransferase [Litoreibacter arenae DSM 19593]
MTPDELAALHEKCFDIPRPWSSSEFTELQRNAFVLTAPHGFLMGRVTADEAELLTLAVDPAALRQGTGRSLVEAFKTRAAQDGAVTAFLEVAADNAAAISLYNATGFSGAGIRRGYYRRPDGTGIDALVMRCELVPR